MTFGSYIRPESSKSIAESALSNLKASPSQGEVDQAMINWAHDLAVAIRKHKLIEEDGEIADLLVAFIDESGSMYLYKEVLDSFRGKVIERSSNSYRQRLDNSGTGVFYSGLCRAFENTGARLRQIALPPVEDAEMRRLGAAVRSTSFPTSDALGTIALEMVQTLATARGKLQKNGDPVEIGPPFQVATRGPRSNIWKTSFLAPCVSPVPSLKK